jgi:hypothetical protein
MKKIQYRCKTDHSHIFDTATEDFWCPTCPIEKRSSLELFETEASVVEEITKTPVEEEKPSLITTPPVPTETPVAKKPKVAPKPLSTEAKPVPISQPNPEPIKEVDNSPNNYELKIGNQIWQKTFLNIRKIEGLKIASNELEWNEALAQQKPAACYPNDNPELAQKLGILYNWYALDLLKPHLPSGYRIPTENDITQLNHLIRKSNSTFFDFKNITLHHRLPNATFGSDPRHLSLWLDDDIGHYTAQYFQFKKGANTAAFRSIGKNAGLFIRCIKV